MEEYKIINYEERYSSELKKYIKKVHSELSEEYISFCVDNLIRNDNSPSLLVIDCDEKIVGCHLFFFSEMMKRGQINEVLWGHETYLNKECRKYIGLDFVLKIKKYKGAGIGLSEINTKIQNKLHGNFLEGLYQYIIPSFYIFKTVFWRIFKIKPSISLSAPDVIDVRDGNFILVQKPEDFQDYNNGYWCNGHIDADFKRDRDYISYRFFNNVKNYYVYQLKTKQNMANCYFVVRPIIYKGFQMLSVVDYRYRMGEENFRTILKAAEKIALRNKIGALYLMSSDPFLQNNKRIKYTTVKWSTQIIASPSKINKKESYLVTSAEADVDFQK